jgi:hypothetical protein
VTSGSVECRSRLHSRHDDRVRTEYGSHLNCRRIQIVAWNYRRADIPALVVAPIAPPPPSSRDPNGGNPPHPFPRRRRGCPHRRGWHGGGSGGGSHCRPRTMISLKPGVPLPQRQSCRRRAAAPAAISIDVSSPHRAAGCGRITSCRRIH